MQFGFEREFFITNGGDFCLVPSGVPSDECGYLAEARGEPHTSPLSAAYLLMAEETRLRQQLLGSPYRLSNENTMRLNPAVLRAALRRHGKAAVPQGRRNLYDKDYPASDRFQRAGLHIHFSDNRRIMGANGVQVTVPGFFDPIPFIKGLDRHFAITIRTARRVPGMYELKPHGFEYRSLPQSADVVEVAGVIQRILNS